MSEGVMQGPAATATDFQRAQARTELECRILAVGGPATGKTSLIVGRLERLVSAGLPAESIVSVTPTAGSAANQRSTLATLCGNRVVGALRVDSLDGMAAGLVRRHWTRLGYPTEPAFVTPSIRAALLRDLFSDGEDHGWGRSPEIARQTAFLRTVLTALEGKGAVGCGLEEERFVAFERRYRDELRQRGIFDRPSAFANATRLLIDGAEDVRSIDHLLADDVDHYRSAAREFLRALAAGASSMVATASIDHDGATGVIDVAADLDCRPLVLVADGSPETTPSISWTHRETSVEELEAMTERMLALRRSGVVWDDINVVAMDDGIAERVASACRRAHIPIATDLAHPWVTHLDGLLRVLADGADDAKAAEIIVAAVGSGLADLDPGFGANALRRALADDDPIGHLATIARSERGEARRLVPVLDCFQRAKKAAAEGRDVATVAWMLWRGMPVAARLAALRASSATDRSMIVGARSVAAWHRDLRAAVALERGLTVAQWHAAQRIFPAALAAASGRDGLPRSSVHIRRVSDLTSSVGGHLLIPLLGLDDRTLPEADVANVRRVVALSRSTVFVSGSGRSGGRPSFLIDDPPSPVAFEEKLAESDATVLLRAVGSSSTAIDDQIVIAAALDAIDIDVPWATGGVSNGSITSVRANVHPPLNGSALSRLNRCGLRVWFGEILGLGETTQSSEELLAAEVRAALREWSEKGDFSDEAGLTSLFEARVVTAVRPTLSSQSLLGPLRTRLATIAAVVCRHTTLPIGEPIATGVDVFGELFGVTIDLTVDLLLSHPGGLELLQWQTSDGLVDRLAGEIDLNLAVGKLAEMFPQHDIAAGSVVDVVRGTTVPLTLGADATKRILLEGATRIASGDLLPHRSAECSECPYRVLCPAHPQGRASW